MKMFNITINSCAQDRMVTFISRKGDREIINQVRCFLVRHKHNVRDENSQYHTDRIQIGIRTK